MKYLLLSLFSLSLIGCIQRPVVEAPTEIYIAPEGKQYKAEVVKLKPPPLPIENDWTIEIRDNINFEYWIFSEKDIKEYGLNTLLSLDKIGCSAIREAPRESSARTYDLVSVSCLSTQWIRTRDVGCSNGIRDSAFAENEFISINLICDGIRDDK
jgi:hypothetical protein